MERFHLFNRNSYLNEKQNIKYMEMCAFEEMILKEFRDSLPRRICKIYKKKWSESKKEKKIKELYSIAFSKGNRPSDKWLEKQDKKRLAREERSWLL